MLSAHALYLSRIQLRDDSAYAPPDHEHVYDDSADAKPKVYHAPILPGLMLPALTSPVSACATHVTHPS